MKKTVLNLRNLGFALVASTAMFAFSCGGEETVEGATEAADDAATEVEAEATEAVDAAVEAACDMGDAADSAAAMACDGGEGAEHSCDH